MKNSQSKAITRCYQQGIYVTCKNFRLAIQEYNGNKMPISKRVMMVARNWDTDFFIFLKSFLNKSK